MMKTMKQLFREGKEGLLSICTRIVYKTNSYFIVLLVKLMDLYHTNFYIINILNPIRMFNKMKKVLFSEETPTYKPTMNNSSSAPFKPVTEDGRICVHPETHNPTRAWEMLKVKQTVNKVKHLSSKTPISPNKVRCVCISDTHNKTSNLPESIPDGDVLLHAGDFTMVGHPKQVEDFNDFLGKLPHKHKVVIAGNHELTFDPDFLRENTSLRRFGMISAEIRSYMKERGISKMSDVLTNCTAYLEDSGTEIHGIKIFGSPWQPWFGDWGFNLERGQPCLDKWNMIPEDTDILITHGPPIGHGDMCFSQERSGCVELLHTIQNRIKPKYHIFGHIHEGYGVTSDGTTTYINGSVCTIRYKPTNPPVIFDIPLPKGLTKEDFLHKECGMEVDTDLDSGSSGAQAFP